MMTLSNKWSLNPFGTGQCLSTYNQAKEDYKNGSQSLWNRAMSFDERKELDRIVFASLNPFGTGQCLSTLYAASTG